MIYLVISVFLITAFICLYLKKDIFYPAVCVKEGANKFLI